MQKLPKQNNLNNINSMRGFNKTPGQLGEYIYNSTHEPVSFRDKKQELNDYTKSKVNDPSKQIRAMKKFKGFNNELGG